MNNPYDYENEDDEPKEDPDSANPNGIPRPMPKEEGPKKKPKASNPKKGKDDWKVSMDSDPTPPHGTPRPHMGLQFRK